MAPALTLQGIDKSYCDGDGSLRILCGANLSVACGEIVAIVGKSGSGKSTLLNIAGLLDRPDEGRVLIDGIDATNLSDRERTMMRARKIGFVFQNYHMLPDFTVLENVILGAAMGGSGMGRAIRLRALEWLDKVGLAGRESRLPARLSGGEQQRAAIARALMAEPVILLCDEPTGNLDPQTAADVTNWLWRAAHNAGMGMVVVTHDTTLATRAQRIIRLENGALQE